MKRSSRRNTTERGKSFLVESFSIFPIFFRALRKDWSSCWALGVYDCVESMEAIVLGFGGLQKPLDPTLLWACDGGRWPAANVRQLHWGRKYGGPRPEHSTLAWRLFVHICPATPACFCASSRERFARWFQAASRSRFKINAGNLFAKANFTIHLRCAPSIGLVRFGKIHRTAQPTCNGLVEKLSLSLEQVRKEGIPGGGCHDK